MRVSSWIVCSAFLQKCPPDEGSSLLKYLSAEEREIVSSFSSTFGDPTVGISSLKSQLRKIHFSWFLPFLRSLSERDIRFFVSALEKEQIEPLVDTLKLSDHTRPISSYACLFLQETLFKKVSSDLPDLLPVEYLPSSSLNPLLHLSLPSLENLVRFLGLHDLALEVKYIIDTKKLKKLYASLSESEQNYLKMLLQSQEPIAFARMALSQWQEEEETLKTLIYQRGFNRLAKAFYGENPSLIWHLSHKMEVDQALLFQKLCYPLDNPTAKSILSGQVLELLSFMREHNE